jgi:hypothetical protein
MAEPEPELPSTLENTTTIRVFKADAALVTQIAANAKKSVAVVFSKIMADAERHAFAVDVDATPVR